MYPCWHRRNGRQHKFLAGQLVDGDFLNSSPGLFSHRLVVGIFLGCPPYIVAGVIVEYDEFIT